jgi:hypothetical protein
VTFKFELDRNGGAEVLKRLAADEIHALTQKIAANAKQDADDLVWVHEGVTDRAHGSVTVPAAEQAKHGTLTKAAAAAGLEVRAK